MASAWARKSITVTVIINDDTLPTPKLVSVSERVTGKEIGQVGALLGQMSVLLENGDEETAKEVERAFQAACDSGRYSSPR